MATKELRTQINRAKHAWLKEQAKAEGFDSLTGYTETIIDRHLFSSLYLQGKFGKSNAREVRKLLVLEKKRAEIA